MFYKSMVLSKYIISIVKFIHIPIYSFIHTHISSFNHEFIYFIISSILPFLSTFVHSFQLFFFFHAWKNNLGQRSKGNVTAPCRLSSLLITFWPEHLFLPGLLALASFFYSSLTLSLFSFSSTHYLHPLNARSDPPLPPNLWVAGWVLWCSVVRFASFDS